MNDNRPPIGLTHNGVSRTATQGNNLVRLLLAALLLTAVGAVIVMISR